MKRRTNGEKSLVKKEETSKGFKDKDTKSGEREDAKSTPSHSSE